MANIKKLLLNMNPLRTKRSVTDEILELKSNYKIGIHQERLNQIAQLLDLKASIDKAIDKIHAQIEKDRVKPSQEPKNET